MKQAFALYMMMFTSMAFANPPAHRTFRCMDSYYAAFQDSAGKLQKICSRMVSGDAAACDREWSTKSDDHAPFCWNAIAEQLGQAEKKLRSTDLPFFVGQEDLDAHSAYAKSRLSEIQVAAQRPVERTSWFSRTQSTAPAQTQAQTRPQNSGNPGPPVQLHRIPVAAQGGEEVIAAPKAPVTLDPSTPATY